MSKKILKIIDLTYQGQGIARTEDDKVVFVHHAIPGDIVKVNLKPLKKNIWQAENIEIVKKSEHRIDSICPSFNSEFNDECLKCGGCQIQQMNYDALAKIKQRHVYDKLERLAGIDLEKIKIQSIIKAERTWYYRNHIQLKINYDKNKQKYVKGFYAERSHDIVKHDFCYIAPKVENVIWENMEFYLQKSNFQAEFQNHFKELILRVGERTEQILFAFVLDLVPASMVKNMARFKSEISELAKAINQNLRRNFEQKELISIYLIEKKKKQIHLWGKSHLVEKILDKQFQIYPQSFFQVNTIQAEKLFSTLLAHLKDKREKSGTLFDLYCGTGVIGIVLSDYFQQIKGVEVFADAIRNAKENAKINGLQQAEYEQGEAGNWLLQQDVKKSDFIVVDPPRKGLDDKLIQALLDINAEHLIYVSCNPATLARDLKKISPNWQVDNIQPVDLFPWTMHVETVALLSRVDKY